MKKTPYMPLYVKEAWSDERFLLLPWDAQGLFWRLAGMQWLEGSIPSDVKAIIDLVGKPQATRRLWPTMLEFFGADSNDTGRLRNDKLEAIRVQFFGEKDRRGRGAAITNAKRWGSDPTSEDQSDDESDVAIESLQRQESESLRGRAQGARAATATAVASSSRSLEGVKGEPPDFAAVERLEPRFEQVGLSVLPPQQVLVGWVQDFGETLILAVLAEREGTLKGKHYTYLQPILMDRKENPRENRSKSARKQQGNQAQPSAKDFGMRTIDDVLADKRSV